MTRKVRNPKRPDANGNHVDKTLTARAAERDAVGGVGGAFIAVIKEALDHTNSPTWLGQHTPLAQPYFLGHWLANESDAHTPKGRGRVLARLLLDSVKNLLDPHHSEIISAYYFDPTVRAKANRANELADRFFRSRQTIMRELKLAIGAVAQQLSELALPPLRAESPIPDRLIGRETLVDAAVVALQNRRTVAFAGNSGLGKTSTGIAVTECWGHEHVLWFTVRPRVSDRLANLVFALGHWLRQMGAESTWLQLVAEGGVIKDQSRIESLIRHDVSQLSELPLLCVDDVDVLQPDDPGHSPILSFLEAMNGHLPMLLMGQRISVHLRDPKDCMELEGLTSTDLAAWLSQEHIALSADEIPTLLRVTQANPGLIRLFLILHRAGEPLQIQMRRMATSLTTDAVLERIWTRLEESERNLLAAMSVFRAFAPRDAWSQALAHAAMDSLLNRGLLVENGQGGIAISPYVLRFVSSKVPADLQPELHATAGHAFEERGEHTLAALHYIEARVPELAVRLWATHRATELSRGQAGTALALLRNIPSERLTQDDDRRMHVLILADLLTANGESSEATRQLNSVSWPVVHPLTPLSRLRRGAAFEKQDLLTQAEQQYTAALEALTTSPEGARILLRRHLGYLLNTRMRETSRARKEALKAYVEACLLLGNVEEDSGDYDAARQYYQSGLSIAHSLPDGEIEQCSCHSNLGRLAMRQGEAQTALVHLEQSVNMAEKLGWVTFVVTDLINVSSAHVIAKQYDQALSVAEDGLKRCESFTITTASIVAGLASNAGEACHYLGRHTDAFRYAMQAEQTEEPGHLPYARIVMGMTQRAQNQLREADLTLSDALNLSQQLGDRYAEASALRELGELFAQQGRKQEACSAFTRSAKLFSTLKNRAETEALESRVASLCD